MNILQQIHRAVRGSRRARLEAALRDPTLEGIVTYVRMRMPYAMNDNRSYEERCLRHFTRLVKLRNRREKAIRIHGTEKLY